MKEYSFNKKIYESLVKEVTDNKHDINFLCNEMSKLYKKLIIPIDSARVCKDNNGKWSKDFEEKITCCNVENVLITNPLTKNKYWIGFNHNH